VIWRGITCFACFCMKFRWSHALLPAALALLAVVYVRFEPLKWAHYTDPVVYLSGAQSLAEGHGYRYAPYVQEPRIACHPPLQSAYLALFWWAAPSFPDNLPVLYGAMILLALAAFVLFHLVARHSGVPAWLTPLLILAWGLGSAWGTLIYAFFSDILFVILWLGLALYWLRNPDPDRERTWFATGLFLALLYLTRSAALPLIGVTALWLYARARRGQGGWTALAACLAPVLAAGLMWKAYKTGAPGYGDYIFHRISEEAGWAGLLSVMQENAFAYLTGQGFLQALLPGLVNLPSSDLLGNTILSPILTLLFMLGGWLLMAMWAYGCFWKGTPLDRLGGVMVVAYLLELTVYPTALGERGLFPVLPFILIWSWKGRELVVRRPWMTRLAPATTTVLLAATVATNGIRFTSDMGYLQHSNYADDLQEIGDWLRTNTPPETVVAAALSEPVMHLHHVSDRRVIENYFQPTPWFSIVSHGMRGSPNADYLLLSWYSWMTLDESNFNRFDLVARSSRSHYRLYRVGRSVRNQSVKSLPEETSSTPASPVSSPIPTPNPSHSPRELQP